LFCVAGTGTAEDEEKGTEWVTRRKRRYESGQCRKNARKQLSKWPFLVFLLLLLFSVHKLIAKRYLLKNAFKLCKIGFYS
jgi:hypothetical protein